MNEHDTELEHYQAAIEGMEACIIFLYAQAQSVSDTYLEEVAELDRLNSRAGFRKMGVGIQLSCTRKGNHLDLKWTGVKWYGPKAARASKWIAITKSKEKQCYTIERIRPYAQEWQIELIKETEEKLTRIRRKATHVVAGITNMRNAIRVLNADKDVMADAILEGSHKEWLQDVGTKRQEL